MGVTTGITLEFQFGTNWAYYSHYVGDIFGTPLAVEGLMAFFLESTLVGLFFFGWDKLSRGQHLLVTALVALGSNLSALWILIANGWMQNPVGAEFNPMTMRMELTDVAAVLLNPVAQVKFVHTVAAGYVAASLFVMGVSSWYLLRRMEVRFALRSFAIASGFGLAAILSVIVLGTSRLPLRGGAEGQARRHRGGVGDRTRSCLLHPVRPAGSGCRDHSRGHQDPLPDGHHSHPLLG